MVQPKTSVSGYEVLGVGKDPQNCLQHKNMQVTKQALHHPQHQLNHQEEKIAFTMMPHSVYSLVCCSCI